MGRYVDTPSGPIHEVDFGGSGTNLLLVHGLGGSTTNWDAVAPSLTELGRVRAIDLPGFGLTPPRADFRLDTHRSAVVQYLELIGGPATLVGNSTGGLLSLMIASHRPDLVERLILVSPATPPVLPDPRLDWPTAIRLAIQATPLLGWLYGRHFIRSNSPDELVWKSLSMITHKPGRVPMAVIESSREMARIRRHLPWAEYATAKTATGIASLYARRQSFDAMVRAIEAPALVLQGLADHIVSPTAVERLCSLRPAWVLVQMEDTGHTPQMDAPLRFLEVVTPWLAAAISEPVGA